MEVNYLLNFYFLNLKKYLINRKNSRLYVNYFIKNGLRVYLYPINLKNNYDSHYIDYSLCNKTFKKSYDANRKELK